MDAESAFRAVSGAIERAKLVALSGKIVGTGYTDSATT